MNLSKRTDIIYICSFGRGQQTRIVTDANFCKDAEDGVSVSGVLAFFRDNLVHWRSHKQTAVAVSTAEAELAALREGLLMNIILRDLLAELGQYPAGPTPCHLDNTAVIKSVKSNHINFAMRHVSTSIHKAREQLQLKAVELHYVKSAQNCADVLTKAMGPTKFRPMKDKLVF